MLCCLGLIGGLAVGQSLGGPWTYIAPAAGFGIGLIADMKLMKGHHTQKTDQHDTGVRVEKDTVPVLGHHNKRVEPDPGVRAEKDTGPVLRDGSG